MGLDMYLMRAPKYKNTTIRQIDELDSYFNYMSREDAQKYTLKEWCGIDETDLPDLETQMYYKEHCTIKYPSWDIEHNYGSHRIIEDVGYWRKANAIHKWFVDNVQNGEDDCGIYEVSRAHIEVLLGLCKLVKEHSKLVPGKVIDCYKYVDGQKIPQYEEGEVIEDPSVAQMCLPTQPGFFFGGLEYDDWYLDGIDKTIEILEKVLEETDFDTQMIAYQSSW